MSFCGLLCSDCLVRIGPVAICGELYRGSVQIAPIGFSYSRDGDWRLSWQDRKEIDKKLATTYRELNQFRNKIRFFLFFALLVATVDVTGGNVNSCTSRTDSGASSAVEGTDQGGKYKRDDNSLQKNLPPRSFSSSRNSPTNFNLLPGPNGSPVRSVTKLRLPPPHFAPGMYSAKSEW